MTMAKVDYFWIANVIYLGVRAVGGGRFGAEAGRLPAGTVAAA